MRIAVIQFPGSNCERETMLAIKRAGMEPIACLWNENPHKLHACAGFVIVGGFSYEDRSRAGIIAALDPIMQTLKVQAELGKPILGICNGAQILVESGLVPGLENNKLGLALTENKRLQGDKLLGTGYYNAWVHLKLAKDYQRNAFTRYLKPETIIRIPVAHAEGRFVMSSALYDEITTQGLDILQYCDQNGVVNPEFPINPNGSIGNMAALANKAGNVLAIMPHPERTPVGDILFQSMRAYIEDGIFEKVLPLYYYPRPVTFKMYQKSTTAKVFLVRLIITDNAAKTVEATLKAHGFAVQVQRLMHWEVECSDDLSLQGLLASGLLYNERKEKMVSALTPDDNQTVNYLVRAKDDMRALEVQQALKQHYHIPGIKVLRSGVLWQFSQPFSTLATNKINDLIQPILKTNIIHNPYAHDCYQYND